MPKQTEDVSLSDYYNCVKCGQCCHFFEMIVNPRTLKINGLLVNEAFKKELKIGFKTENIYQCSVRVNITCDHFDKTTGLCKIYDKRPSICRRHFCQRYPKIEEEK